MQSMLLRGKMAKTHKHLFILLFSPLFIGLFVRSVFLSCLPPSKSITCKGKAKQNKKSKTELNRAQTSLFISLSISIYLSGELASKLLVCVSLRLKNRHREKAITWRQAKWKEWDIVFPFLRFSLVSIFFHFLCCVQKSY